MADAPEPQARNEKGQFAVSNPLDPDPALRAELMAAIAVIDPMIKGLEDLSTIPPSSDLGLIVAAELAKLQHRRILLDRAVGALDIVVDARITLVDDGYPVIDQVQIPTVIFDELNAEVANVQAAAKLFQSMAPTSVEFDVADATFSAKNPKPAEKG